MQREAPNVCVSSYVSSPSRSNSPVCIDHVRGLQPPTRWRLQIPRLRTRLATVGTTDDDARVFPASRVSKPHRLCYTGVPMTAWRLVSPVSSRQATSQSSRPKSLADRRQVYFVAVRYP